ncbi:hypothetical protein Nepgr_018259 [Nepenthes gracilis]|uniref:Uncharacterized protein n=1 Tax=Nepenthes gracilis TaxID=150966 RepID=A0AAD3SRY0_NEPGR|nr:hypothetical protein Nepgr_018259 [Nepenthes gracilis]
MDPCPFVRITVGNLALKFPAVSKHPPESSIIPAYNCKIKFNDTNPQVACVPLIPRDANIPDNCHQLQSVSACFNLSKSDLERLVDESKRRKKPPCLQIEVYGVDEVGRRGFKSCGLCSGKFLGRVSIPLDLNRSETRTSALHNGWLVIGKKKRNKKNGWKDAQLHVSAKSELDPRFVFHFVGDPECSPQVVQVQGNFRQPVFSCKFCFRNSGDWNLRSSSSLSEPSTSRSWLSSFKCVKEQATKERKGWSITIHDLSGSPVAAASMVTPFVPLPGSDRVSRSNPGAWLILRPSDGTWKPWGRLEAWRERGRGGSDSLGYRFELLPDAALMAVASAGVTLSSGTISTKTGGKFSIDIRTYNSPISSPNSSFDFGSWSGSGSSLESGSGWLPQLMCRGFVMSSTVGGERREGSRPEVEVGVQHVTCTEDAAVFVALAAAMDLSMDACKLFSHKLRKELRQQGGESVV